MSNNKIEISIKDIPIVVEELEKANAEIERLNKIIEKNKYSADELNEIERLNNIINELEKWIKENNLGKYRTENVIDTDELLDKLQELKGSNKE